MPQLVKGAASLKGGQGSVETFALMVFHRPVEICILDSRFLFEGALPFVLGW